ncbi:MAG: hypothetical protein J6R10_02415 [Tidjanibacter sp.]|nr:hypothetical protein [Tidjanibacter sp.]
MTPAKHSGIKKDTQELLGQENIGWVLWSESKACDAEETAVCLGKRQTRK